ncbi:hypothetical protein [Anaeromyxobacter oryzae]|uniref:DUF4390 domain-containing protein n=1 Tax=Anaeromyxobacter oryzae TaxID=2918170 RepID=A0ABM7WRI8_9BACT|nr:hypothetical protein [Anaeromyxobacter oryzae]BDG02072.1 hypothetical protein AMOR_10680 [Anaeromyxobacter oryzae]
MSLGRHARGLAAAFAIGVAALTAPAARAAAPAPLPVRLATRGDVLLATLDLSSVFVPSMEHQLGNGLTNVIALWVAVLPESGGEAEALYGRVIEILFDVWEETYTVVVKDARAPAGIRVVLRDFAALRAFLSNVHDIDLGLVSDLPTGRFVIEARVEVNPVSKEQLQRTREYIANPPAGARPGGGASRSVLGAVASFLLREPDPGTDVHRLRSRPFARSEVAAR